PGGTVPHRVSPSDRASCNHPGPQSGHWLRLGITHRPAVKKDAGANEIAGKAWSSQRSRTVGRVDQRGTPGQDVERLLEPAPLPLRARHVRFGIEEVGECTFPAG